MGQRHGFDGERRVAAGFGRFDEGADRGDAVAFLHRGAVLYGVAALAVGVGRVVAGWSGGRVVQATSIWSIGIPSGFRRGSVGR